MFSKILLLSLALISVIVIFDNSQNIYAAQVEEITLDPGETDATPLKLDEQIRVKGGVTVEGFTGVTIEGIVDDKIKFWVTKPDGTHQITPRTVDPSDSFDFTTETKGTYTFFYENSDAFLGFKTVTLTYNTEDLKPTPIDEAMEGGGCLIATATYGTELAPQVQFLREVRDNTLLSTTSGLSFMTGFNQLYYSFSPTIADWERQNPVFKEATKLFITPMISTLSIMALTDEGSENQVLGLGISVIALNLGMYVVVPTIAIWQVKKQIVRVLN